MIMQTAIPLWFCILHFDLYGMEELTFSRKRRSEITTKCPCGKSNRDGKFAPFEGFTDKGYCHSCDEAFLPDSSGNSIQKYEAPKIPLKYIDKQMMMKSMREYEHNNLYKYVQKVTNRANELFRHFKVGTDKDGSAVFWLVDFHQNIRQPKLMMYGSDGHRLGDPRVSPGFTKYSGYTPCLFGEEHIRPGKVIILVESEKTAILGHSWLPKYIWLASGGVSGLSKEKASVLMNNQVLIVPDADGAGRSGAAKTMERLAENTIGVRIVDLFPKQKGGYDIGDFVENMQKCKVQ